MKKISVYKDSVLTNVLGYTTQEEINFFHKQEQLGTFGAPAYSYESELTPAIYEDGEEILDENEESFNPPQFEQVLITPATFETINIPAGYETVEEDITAQYEADQVKIQKQALGRAAREACENVLDLIAGFNFDRELTGEQITEMQTLFSNPEKALRASRPSTAKILISAITPDEVLVTQEMKDLCIDLLSAY